MNEFFDEVFDLPDPEKNRQFRELVGLDQIKEHLIKEGRLLINPELLDNWSSKYHGMLLPAVANFHNRPPLVVFCGDVGTGKTTLANSFGDAIARTEKISVQVLRLSLNTRGTGAVGEMTRLITQAFREVVELVQKKVTANQKLTYACILVIDEADAFAQSRENDQMHHEDRAGVNAIIRGIDQLTTARLPVIVVMCTNRIEAIDPAILRRAAAQFTFERPNDEQRLHLLKSAFGDVFADKQVQELVGITGPIDGREYGYTYSDFTQRLIPNVLIEAFPDRPITFELTASVARQIKPTKYFKKPVTNPKRVR